eukprot:NODE_129_length_16972_cov_2.172643.p1 type:complete len:470 gc:universal NODE_129_length_16972_cov_2.172643:2664-1255(-)
MTATVPSLLSFDNVIEMTPIQVVDQLKRLHLPLGVGKGENLQRLLNFVENGIRVTENELPILSDEDIESHCIMFGLPVLDREENIRNLITRIKSQKKMHILPRKSLPPNFGAFRQVEVSESDASVVDSLDSVSEPVSPEKPLTDRKRKAPINYYPDYYEPRKKSKVEVIIPRYKPSFKPTSIKSINADIVSNKTSDDITLEPSSGNKNDSTSRKRASVFTMKRASLKGVFIPSVSTHAVTSEQREISLKFEKDSADMGGDGDDVQAPLPDTDKLNDSTHEGLGTQGEATAENTPHFTFNSTENVAENIAIDLENEEGLDKFLDSHMAESKSMRKCKTSPDIAVKEVAGNTKPDEDLSSPINLQLSENSERKTEESPNSLISNEIETHAAQVSTLVLESTKESEIVTETLNDTTELEISLKSQEVMSDNRTSKSPEKVFSNPGLDNISPVKESIIQEESQPTDENQCRNQ